MNSKKSTISDTASCADPFDATSIRLDEALARIQKGISVITGTELLPIRDCLNRVSAKALKSPINVPALANSAMDGYAISSADLSSQGITHFKQIGIAYAGTVFDTQCLKLECVRIMTGAVVPKGTDAVIMQEQVEINDKGEIAIGANHRLNENIRQAGEDVAVGQVILNAGDRLGPADLGVLASLGIAKLEVIRKPKVAFFSTGDELVGLGEKLPAGKIYDSNRYSLFGMLSCLAVDIIDLGVIRDDPQAIRLAFLDAADKADLIISTGGVSVGDADYIKPVLEKLGDIEFWKIAIKPGRPLTFGTIEGSSFIGLPGNPVAVMVTFSQFVIPALSLMSGAQPKAMMLFKARCLDKINKKPGRYEFQRGIATVDENGQWQVQKSAKQGSGILTSMSRANCFIVLNEDAGSITAGDNVDIQFFDWSLDNLQQ